MTMMMAPSKAVLAGLAAGETHGDGDAPAAVSEVQAENRADGATDATASGAPAENGVGAAVTEPVGVDGADAPSPEPQA
jgi:hypothetical protein